MEIENKLYKCSKCKIYKKKSFFYELKTNKATRCISYYCKECLKKRERVNDIKARQRKKYKTECLYCGYYKKLFYGKCKQCYKKLGLKQCNKCKLLLSIHMNFFKNKGRCKTCYG